MASNLIAMALLAVASNLLAMASNLLAMRAWSTELTATLLSDLLRPLHKRFKVLLVLPCETCAWPLKFASMCGNGASLDRRRIS